MLDRKDFRVHKVLSALKDLQVLLDRKVFRDAKVYKVLPALLDPRACKAYKAQLA